MNTLIGMKSEKCIENSSALDAKQR